MKKFVMIALVLVLALSLSVASAVTLKSGSSGTLVKRVQEFLNAGNYGNLTVDGVYGTSTVAAVKRYQSINSLKVDGICGPRTLKLMGINTNNDPTGEADDDDDDDLRVCQYGSTGTKVKAIQQALKALSYPIGSADGKFGAKTRTCVRYFQQLNNLTVDGKVGPTTYNLLMSGTAAPYNASGNSTKTYTTLRKGSSGTKVKKLQQALCDAGYTCDITGYYSEDTKSAVKEYQAAAGLTVDGIAGSETQAALYGGV